MAKFKYVKTNEGMSIIIDEQIFLINESHPEYNKVMRLLVKEKYDEIENLLADKELSTYKQWKISTKHLLFDNDESNHLSDINKLHKFICEKVKYQQKYEHILDFFAHFNGFAYKRKVIRSIVLDFITAIKENDIIIQKDGKFITTLQPNLKELLVPIKIYDSSKNKGIISYDLNNLKAIEDYGTYKSSGVYKLIFEE